MLQASRLVISDMLQLANFDRSRRVHWCTTVVLLAVTALTVSVTTRYTFSFGASGGPVTKVHKHSSPEPARQRLIKNAATWMPPVVYAVVFLAPSAYPRLAPSGPPIASLFFEKNLYNRPPPFQNLSFS